MKRFLIATSLVCGIAVAPALAEDPSPKGPAKTMGDEGKLPATGTVGGKVPDMGATAPAEVGQRKKMGDEGKLPATGAVSGATPKMNPK